MVRTVISLTEEDKRWLDEQETPSPREDTRLAAYRADLKHLPLVTLKRAA